jgi:hypothetical protein
MYKNLVLLACCALLCTTLPAQKKIIAVIGSSTVAGFGSTPNPNPNNPNNPPDSCWASIVLRYYKGFNLLDTLQNLGRPGTTTFFGLPAGSTYPNGDPMVANLYNVTAAIDPNRFNADIVIVSYASNDADSQWSVQQTMQNLHTIYNTVVAAGRKCFITTTQPRTTWDLGVPAVNRQKQKDERDMILADFGVHALDFYTPLVSATGDTINGAFRVDGIHVNNAGHRALAAVVEGADLLNENPNPLPLTLSDFTASYQSSAVVLNWVSSDQQGPASFTVQRSGDGVSFEDLERESAFGSASPVSHSWTDQNPLSGKGYYRIRWTDDGGDHYTQIVSVIAATKEWAIGKIYYGQGSTLSFEVQTPRNQAVTVQIVNASGVTMVSRVFSIVAPSSTLSIAVPKPAPGLYFLKVVSASGESAVKSWNAF